MKCFELRLFRQLAMKWDHMYRPLVGPSVRCGGSLHSLGCTLSDKSACCINFLATCEEHQNVPFTILLVDCHHGSHSSFHIVNCRFFEIMYCHGV
jgi:hypothetical protein